MKSTGIVRRVDELGRIVIPKEIRTRMKMDSGDLVDICISEEQVVLSKFQPLDHDSQIVEAFCDSLKDTYHSDIIITDSHQILYNTLSSDLNGALLADDFLKRVNAY
ncbi:MAG: AbrB/MazE/SpoVT family DNA-binding domain-containing protein, partial [Anaeroplasmataceae bacterium]|nr:AbrB/MazE/SpoVT family DNA-binding domain-containing protein [Anaeroplasmataceae bacterium]